MNKTPTIIIKSLLYILLVMVFFSSTINSQEPFPNKPITLVVAFGIGGSADRMTRTMSGFLAKELGQPVKVINIKGAGTLLGANYVLEKAADGYTILASAFSPYLSNTILEGHANYSIDDFAYLNFQWFDEDLISISKLSKYKTLPEIIEAIRTKPKTVRASVVRGSAGHLMAKLLLEVNNIPTENLNLVTYNGGGQARAAVAGGVVDFIIISAKGCEGIREYINPVAIGSQHFNKRWQVSGINDVLKEINIKTPLLPGSIRGFATAKKVQTDYPQRFKILSNAFQRALDNPKLQQALDKAAIGKRWTGTEEATQIMQETFGIFKNYSYLLKL